MLRITPSDRLYVDVPASGASSESRLVLTNVLHLPVLFKIQIRTPAEDGGNGGGRVLAVTPKAGLVMPDKAQRVSVAGAASSSSPSSSGQGDDRLLLPSVCKLVVQSKVAVGAGDAAARDCGGDKSTSLWDLSDDCAVPEAARQTHVQEIDVVIGLSPNHNRHLANDIDGSGSGYVNFSSSVSLLRTSAADDDPSGVIGSIHDLVSGNDALRTRLRELEAQRQSEAQELSEARRQARDARAAAQLTTHLLRQLEDLGASRDALEEEINRLKLRDLEKRERLVEKDAELQALASESDRLSRENLRLLQDRHSGAACSNAEGADGNVRGAEARRMPPLLPPRTAPRRMRSRILLQEQIEARSSGESFSSCEGRRRRRRPRRHSCSPSSSSSKARGGGGGDDGRGKGRRTREEGQEGKGHKMWECDDETKLYFLKNMTLLFAGLTILAAANIIVTDLVK